MGINACCRIAWSKLAVIGFAIALGFAAFGQSQPRKETSAQMRLALRLFNDARFSSPEGDLQNSCASCHLLDEDPQGMRAHTDFFARSWVPWRAGDPRRDGLRNAPTIFDSALTPRLHFDGEFGSLEELVKGTLAGRPMGWLPGERDQAFDRVYGIILKDTAKGAGKAANYRMEFKAAYGMDPETLSRSEVIDRLAKAIADYMRTLKSARTTPYDRFVQANGLDAGPAPDKDPNLLASRILNQVGALEKERTLKLPDGFDASALEGMKVFFRTDGKGATGNCVACHAPPLFTDFSFHNLGISQAEYDQVNGYGSFAELKIPAAAQASRPSAQFRETPSRRKPGCADLGFWNFVDLKTSPLRRTGESDDQFLQRMIGTFKTPTLRNLAFSQPYMHTGGFSTIEGALTELMRLSELARAGKVREGDEQLTRINITEADIAPLAAFLMTLNEALKPGPKY
ncbi:MAG: cytochrome c peroxidase [Acidobacteriota bacterium]